MMTDEELAKWLHLTSKDAEIERLRALIKSAWRELENILVSVHKRAPDRIGNQTLNALRDECRRLEQQARQEPPQ